MIKYNPRDWFGLIFFFHKSDTFRKLLPLMFCVAVYTGLIAYVEIEIWRLKFKTVTIMHSLLGFVLSLLLVFRTNTAYDRWWEGRRLWGNLLNNSRNLSIKLHAFIEQENLELRGQFVRLISDYGFALREHLFKKITNKNTVIDESEPAHKPNDIARKLFYQVNEMYNKQQISGEQFLIVNAELQSFADICGACERIKKTPIPYSYNIFIKKFVFAYILTMPFAFVTDFGYWVVMITVFVFYALVSLELIAEEIEDPFGEDENDLPMNEIADNIRRSTEEILLIR